MKAQEQIKYDLTTYCEKNNCTVQNAISKLSSMLPDATKEEMGNLPEIVYAWQALQIQNQVHMQYHKSEDLGEFIFNTDMYTISVHTYNRLFLHYIPTYKGEIELPEGCISTRYMFEGRYIHDGCTLGDKFDTSNVINMHGMFHGCCITEGFTLGDKFDTSNVKYMSDMFQWCEYMPEGFTLGDKFDTSNVIDMSRMFRNCKLPDGFTLGDKFDTSNVTNMWCMFSQCKLPEGFTLGNKFDTSNVTKMCEMFEECILPDGTDATEMDPHEVIEKLKK